MGGRIHGFLGGVLLVTSAAYYTSAQFRNNQQFVSRTLKDAEDIINGLELEKDQQSAAAAVPRVLHFTHRPVRETVADLWDDSVLTAVRGIYALDLEKTGASIASWISSKTT
jgi:altered-inheritance-of-mitochondria protein 5